jgi:hypothetical protein
MKKSVKTRNGQARAKSARPFSVALLLSILLLAGVVTAIAKYEWRGDDTRTRSSQSQPARSYVPVNVGGKKLQVNAQALQQGPLTQEQAQQLAEALKDNKSTDGLVQVQNDDGSVSMDLQGRFQNVAVARKNDDGSLSQACLDNPAAAGAFLNNTNTNKEADPINGGKAVVKAQ